MSENSEIEWTDNTWSPWEGCQKVGPGCDHCYAESMNRWLRRGENWGPGASRRIYSDDHWEKPGRWNRAAKQSGRTIKVFPSVCDPFDNAAPEDQRVRFARLIIDTPDLTWLLLTKRIGNAATMLGEMFPEGVPRNVWIGATIVNREELLRDARKLKEIRACVRFWSVEPMLGDLGDIPVDLMPDWVICGMESGRGARPGNPAWARSLRDQCIPAGVPFLYKQNGEWIHVPDFAEETCDAIFRFDDGTCMRRVGKKESGRLLDGVLHNSFPDAPVRQS